MSEPRLRARRRWALAAWLGLALALGLAACGGDDEDKQPSSSGTRTDTPGKTTEEGREPKRRKDAESKKRAGEKEEDKLSVERAVKRIPPGKRAAIIRATVPGVLIPFGYKRATVAVAVGGRQVRVILSPAEVCGGPEDPGPIKRAIRKSNADPFIKHIKVVVGAGGQSLPSYIAANCRRQRPPSAKGRVVLKVEGTGRRHTKSFRVTRKRWTVAYANKGTTFIVFLYRHGRLQPQLVSKQNRSVGKKKFKGKGTFKLMVAGPGPWEVVVHDGT